MKIGRIINITKGCQDRQSVFGYDISEEGELRAVLVGYTPSPTTRIYLHFYYNGRIYQDFFSPYSTDDKYLEQLYNENRQ